VSGITITSGGAANTMGGGKEIPIPIFTPAFVRIGVKITNAKNIVPKSSFFILLPPLSITDAIFPFGKKYPT